VIADLLLASLPLLATAPTPSAPPAAAPPARLEVALTPEEVTVGDRVTAVLTLTVPAGGPEGDPLFPAWGERWGEAEVLTTEVPKRLEARGGDAVFRQRLELAAFRPGEVALPPRSVAVPTAAGSAEVSTPEELSFTVASVLPPVPEPGVSDGEDGPQPPPLTPRPEAPPRALPLGAAFWWTAAVGSTACLLLGFWVWRRSGLSPPSSASPPAPWAELETALGRLSAATPGLEGHVILSRALRRYLGRELGFPAPESSTTEIRRSLSARPVPRGVVEDVAAVLSACDLAKFARQPMEGADVARRAETVRRIGRTLDLNLHPPAPAKPSPGAAGSPR
jgi:hypothetical protein